MAPIDAGLRRIAGLYDVGRKLGHGSFGDIFSAVNVNTGEEVAVKLERAKAELPLLLYEAKLMKHLQGVPGIPRVHFAGCDGDHNVMVMDLLGASLEDLVRMRKEIFTLKTVLMVADQMLYRIEYVHSKSFIHRDIKPENFLIGSGRCLNIVNIIDFGLAKRFYDAKTRQHIPFRKGKTLTGTACYASINAHLGYEQSRRDDLEAIGYTILYLARGKLPWQGLQMDSLEEKHAQIQEMKISTPLDVLCDGCPPEFATYISYCRGLGFEDRPDYDYLRQMLREVFRREGFVNDGMLDWSMPVDVDSKLTRAASADPPTFQDQALPVHGEEDEDACGESSLLDLSRSCKRSSTRGDLDLRSKSVSRTISLGSRSSHKRRMKPRNAKRTRRSCLMFLPCGAKGALRCRDD
jgi:casein kinase 1